MVVAAVVVHLRPVEAVVVVEVLVFRLVHVRLVIRHVVVVGRRLVVTVVAAVVRHLDVAVAGRRRVAWVRRQP